MHSLGTQRQVINLINFNSITNVVTKGSICIDMIDSTAVVCGIIFPILAFAILYAIVLIRKSQGYVQVQHFLKKDARQ